MSRKVTSEESLASRLRREEKVGDGAGEWFKTKVRAVVQGTFGPQRDGFQRMFSDLTGIPYASVRQWSAVPRIPRPFLEFLALWFNVSLEEILKQGVSVTEQLRRRKKDQSTIYLLFPEGCYSKHMKTVKKITSAFRLASYRIYGQKEVPWEDIYPIRLASPVLAKDLPTQAGRINGVYEVIFC